MGTTQSTIVGAAMLFLIVFLSGFWLSRSGKPFNGIVLTLHKLISLAALVFLAINLYRTNQDAKLNTMELAAAAVTGLLFLGTIVSGGFLSTDKPLPARVLTLHRIAPFLTVLSTTVTLLLLLGRSG